MAGPTNYTRFQVWKTFGTLSMYLPENLKKMFKSQAKKELEQLSSASSMIAQGVVLEGNLDTTGNLRIEGNVKGNVRCKAKIAIGESSIIEGNLFAQNAEIAGKIIGHVEVSEILILRASSVIEGDILANKVVMENGAVFNGQCKMGVEITRIEFGTERLFKEAIKEAKTA